MSSSDSAFEAPPSQLDPDLYQMDEEEAAFMRQQTGIHDDKSLRDHIFAIQEEAFQIIKYPCIRSFYFLHFKMARQPAYARVLNLLSERKNPILADIGCCFGSDLRKAVADGWPVEYTIGFDLKEEFWNLGHAMYRSTPETFPAHFVAGDIFNSSTLSKRGALTDDIEIEQTTNTPLTSIGPLTSLNPLQGKISVLHASNFFHLFSEERQLELADLLASLLLPKAGSVIMGYHVALPHKGFRKNKFRKWSMFCHSPDSWKDMWISVFKGDDGRGDERISVDTSLVEARIEEHYDQTTLAEDERLWFMTWSVTIL